MKLTAWMTLAAATLAAAACSRPQPAAPAPVQQSDAARRDSLEQLALADSAARADSLARTRTRADVVNEQVQETGMVSDETSASGLAPADSVTIYQLIHFDFDSDFLRPEYQSLLESKLGVLRANPLLQVRINGHADDRGSDEYNMVLGLRRASAVHRWLVNHGIEAGRLTVMSFGEEQPLDARPEEAAWAMNRRAGFMITHPAR